MIVAKTRLPSESQPHILHCRELKVLPRWAIPLVVNGTVRPSSTGTNCDMPVERARLVIEDSNPSRVDCGSEVWQVRVPNVAINGADFGKS